MKKLTKKRILFYDGIVCLSVRFVCATNNNYQMVNHFSNYNVKAYGKIIIKWQRKKANKTKKWELVSTGGFTVAFISFLCAKRQRLMPCTSILHLRTLGIPMRSWRCFVVCYRSTIFIPSFINHFHFALNARLVVRPRSIRFGTAARFLRLIVLQFHIQSVFKCYSNTRHSFA